MKKTAILFWAVLLAIAFAASPLMAAPGASQVEVGTTAKVINIVNAKTLGRRIKLGDKVVYQETVSTGKKPPMRKVQPGMMASKKTKMGAAYLTIDNSTVWAPNPVATLRVFSLLEPEK